MHTEEPTVSLWMTGYFVFPRTLLHMPFALDERKEPKVLSDGIYKAICHSLLHLSYKPVQLTTVLNTMAKVCLCVYLPNCDVQTLTFLSTNLSLSSSLFSSTSWLFLYFWYPLLTNHPC